MPHEGGPPDDRDGMHSGIGGLAHVLAEVRLARAWTDEEAALADGIVRRIQNGLATTTAYSYFDGLVSDIGVLSALEAEGIEPAVARLTELATDDGWEQPWLAPPPFAPHNRINDATLGTAGNLLGAVWAHRHGVAGAEQLAQHAADILLAEAEPTDAGTNWPFVPRRFTAEVPPERRDREMPNWSHGLAGHRRGAGGRGRRARPTRPGRGGPHRRRAPRDPGRHRRRRLRGAPRDPVAARHGRGDLHLVPRPDRHVAALHRARARGRRRGGGGDPRPVAPAVPAQHPHVRASPNARWPGFWDNDGRCCGTAGVGDVFLDAWQRRGVEDDLVFAQVLGDALVARAVVDGDRACWRFTEHRNADPLLPPGVGWMQGAAGIAAYLLRLARVLREGREAAALARLDTWWNVPSQQA